VIPPGLDEKYWHHVRGAQVQLWSEYIATREHLDYMAFPRTAAFAEVVWGNPESLDSFRPRSRATRSDWRRWAFTSGHLTADARRRDHPR